MADGQANIFVAWLVGARGAPKRTQGDPKTRLLHIFTRHGLRAYLVWMAVGGLVGAQGGARGAQDKSPGDIQAAWSA